MKRSRLALGLFSMLALAGLAVFLAVTAGGSSTARSGVSLKFSGDPDAGSMKETASVEKGPASVTAAQEEVAQRAYPAQDLPPDAAQIAQRAWSAVKNRGNGKGKNKPGDWTMIGPSHSNMPGLLVFSGADYTSSGRVTAMALDPSCSQSKCRLWIGAAGGGVWRTTNALGGTPSWTSFREACRQTPSGRSPTTRRPEQLYAGTGEPNASADSETGSGLFKSTDGGDTWTHLAAVTSTTISGVYTGDAFKDRAINSIVVDPTNSNVLYVGSASAIRGVCSVLNGCDAAPAGAASGRGVYKSTDGGATFTLLNGGSLPFVLRGVTDVKLDPSDHNTIYAAQFGQGVFRSTNGGSSWTQIFTIVNPANAANAIERYSLAPTTLPNGKTRIYLGVGDIRAPSPRSSSAPTTPRP